MRKILPLLTLIAITSFAFSQDTSSKNIKKCATQDKLDEAIKKDPSILEKIKEERDRNPKWIERNQHNKDTSSYNYPLIPGFAPTGDPSTDKINFQNAKAKLSNEDIEEYRKLIRKQKESNKQE